MAEYPYYCWFPGDFAAKTHHLTTFEKGVYRQLLDCAWHTKDCELPLDDVLLAKYAGVTSSQWNKMRDTILSFWVVRGDVIYSRKLMSERTRASMLKQRGSKAGTASAAARALKSNDPSPTQVELECNVRPTPTPTPIPREEKKEKSATNELAAHPSKGSTVCGNDWEPDTGTISGLLNEGSTMVEIDRSVLEMRDWSQSGRKLKHNWNATLRNWVRRNKPQSQQPIVSRAVQESRKDLI